MARSVGSKQPRRARLTLESLETRCLLSGTPPTAVEQLFLEQLNDARANPAAYGRSIGLDLSGVAPSQPLAFDPRIIAASRLHSQDMNNQNYFAHNSPQGTDPGQRIFNAGFIWTSWGESIAGGTAFPGPSEALKALIIDSGIPDLGHRRHLLAIDPTFQGQNQVGIGVVQAGTGSLVNYYTVDSASSANHTPFITGVVMADANANAKYDIGEGLGNVTVSATPLGAAQPLASTITWDTGGYSLAVPAGTYTVTASGGHLAAPMSRIVTVGAVNVRETFAQGDDVYIRKLYERVLGRSAGDPEIAVWTTILQGSGGMAAVAGGIESSQEARTRFVKNLYTTYLGRSAHNGEEQGWVGAMLHGATEEDVISGILGSDEFYQHVTSSTAAGTLDEQYVQTLYRLLLKRSPASGEVQLWTRALGSNRRSAIVEGFVHSAEYRTQMVDAFYVDLLHRSAAPPAAEANLWVNSNLDLLHLRIGFESSAEYFQNG